MLSGLRPWQDLSSRKETWKQARDRIWHFSMGITKFPPIDPRRDPFLAASPTGLSGLPAWIPRKGDCVTCPSCDKAWLPLPFSSSFLFIMATERERSDEAACDRNEQQTNTQLQNGTAGNNVQQNDQPQQQQQQQQGSMWKSILVRMFIFWLISNLFRGRQQTTNTSNTAPSTNLFKTDQKIVSWT